MPHAATPVCILCSADPVLRQCAAFDLLVHDPATVVFTHDLDDDGGLVRRVDNADARSREPSATTADCATCAAAADLAQILTDAPRPYARIAYFPPLGMDPMPLARNFGATIAGTAVRAYLSAVAALADAATAVDDLLQTDTFADRALNAVAPDDSVGGALAAQLCFADVIVAHGDAGPGGELIEHVRAHDALLTADLHGDDLTGLLFDAVHDPRAAFARLDPARLRPWSGPCAHGTWTLDLTSDRPFHPLGADPPRRPVLMGRRGRPGRRRRRRRAPSGAALPHAADHHRPGRRA